MAKQIINVGTAANSKNGDSLRSAFQKVNANFTELYAGGLGGSSVDLSAVNQHIIPATHLTYNLGSPTHKWHSLYVGVGSIYIGDAVLSLEAGKLNSSVGFSTDDLTLGGVQIFVNDQGQIEAAGAEFVGVGAPGGAGDRLVNDQAEMVMNSDGDVTMHNGGHLDINGGSIRQAEDEDLVIRVKDAEDDGYRLDLIVVDDNDNTLTRVEVHRDGVEILTNLQGQTAHGWHFRDNGNLQLPTGGIITEDVVGENPTIVIVPADAEVESQVLLIKGGNPGTDIINTQNGITIRHQFPQYAVGDTVLLIVESADLADSTLFWWLEGVDQVTPTSGSIALNGSGFGTTEISVEVLTGQPFRIYVGPNDGDPATAGVSRFINEAPYVSDYHLHLTTGDLTETSIILGTDEHNVRTTILGDIEINTYNYGEGGSNTWTFENRGALRLPLGGDIINSNGQSVLGGGSYTPDNTANWNDPTVNTTAAALDELAARIQALQNFEIDGGNAYTPAEGELIIDGNGA